MPKRVWAWKFRGLLHLPEEGPRVIDASLELEIHDVPGRVKERPLAGSLTHNRGMHDRCRNDEGERGCDTDTLKLFHEFLLMFNAYSFPFPFEGTEHPLITTFFVQTADVLFFSNHCGRTIWIADAHGGDGKRFIVHADEKLTAFLQLETAIRDRSTC